MLASQIATSILMKKIMSIEFLHVFYVWQLKQTWWFAQMVLWQRKHSMRIQVVTLLGPDPQNIYYGVSDNLCQELITPNPETHLLQIRDGTAV